MNFFKVHFLVLINMDQGLNRASSCRKMSKKHDAVCRIALSCLDFELETQSQSLWNNLIYKRYLYQYLPLSDVSVLPIKVPQIVQNEEES